MGGMTLWGAVFRERLSSAFETMLERTQDFTDSAYTSHEHREKILLICDRLKLELNQLLTIGSCLVRIKIHDQTLLLFFFCCSFRPLSLMSFILPLDPLNPHEFI